MKSLVRSALFSLTEKLWTACFFLAGRVNRQPIRRWASPGGQRVLVLAPHPDDEVAGCGGTMIHHLRAGDSVHLVYVTDGRGSRALGLEPEEMAAQRKVEAMTCARILGVTQVSYLGLPENDGGVGALIDFLSPLLDDTPPHVVYTPSIVDFHPEHHKVAHSLALALEQAGAGREMLIRVFQLHVPLTSILGNVVSLTGDVHEQCLQALKAHVSQWGSTRRILRMWRYTAVHYGLPHSAEVFFECSATAYCQMHSQPLPWSSATFRGVRARPFSDPLAYWTGRKARKALLTRTARWSTTGLQNHAG